MNDPVSRSILLFSIMNSVLICSKAFIAKGSNIGFKSLSFKILIITLSVLGFVIFRYYAAMMNAGMNVPDNSLPLKSWEDVAQSDLDFKV